MTQDHRRPLLAVALLAAFAAAAPAAEPKRDRPGRENPDSATRSKSERHVRWVEVGPVRCRLEYEKTAIRVHLFDGSGQSLPAKNVVGTVTVRVEGKPKSRRSELYPEGTQDAAPNALYALVDLRDVRPERVSARFALYGVPGTHGFRPLAFTQVVPATVEPPTLTVASQGACPVTDLKLGAMGQPVTVEVEGQPVFVCCKACIRKVEAKPDFYLRKAQRLASAADRKLR